MTYLNHNYKNLNRVSGIEFYCVASYYLFELSFPSLHLRWSRVLELGLHLTSYKF